MLILKLIDQIPFFWQLTEEERKILVAEEDTFFATYQPEEVLIREDDESDTSLLILMNGEVNITKNKFPDRVIATVGPGAILGEISFLTARPRTTNVSAKTVVIAFKLDGATMRQMDLGLQNKIKDQLIEVLVKRLDEMNDSMLKLIR
ncbi:MAG: cyclic nucleotide-binding domain-containing protein [Magnetococcales bacterium]|nr:cyclic nucleotide-binding domain-containing protein [Magnetococcales bacterium]